MPVKPDKQSGPRKLEAVKVRLRAEQVAREKAAVLRYRQLAEDEAEQPNNHREEHKQQNDTQARLLG
jgi:hypothetical protein